MLLKTIRFYRAIEVENFQENCLSKKKKTTITKEAANDREPARKVWHNLKGIVYLILRQ